MVIAWFIAPRMRVSFRGLYAGTVQAVIHDENVMKWRYNWIFIALVIIGFIRLMVMQR